LIDARQNRLLTESGPRTAGGFVLRQYWQPAALAEELDGERPVVSVRLLGENFVLFRDQAGRLGLLDRACPHRGVDLSFGRPEDGGLRCTFHGWLFDVDGRCLDTPAEPEGSVLKSRVCQPSYPVLERNGIIWAWLGEGDAPPLASLDCLEAPGQQVFAFKGLWACNWFQAQEVGIDPSHASFLHRFLEDEDEQYGLQFRAQLANTGLASTKLLREVPNPVVTVQPTGFGFRLTALRNFQNQFTHVRITNCVFPNAITIPMSGEISITQWHVPIDDTSCYWYAMFVSYGQPVDSSKMRRQRIGAVELPSYRPKIGKTNNWGFDPVEQRTKTFTGMGPDINVHDQWAVESPGAVADRTKEHLSPSDVGIRMHRRLFLAAAENPSQPNLIGKSNPSQRHGPAAIDAVATDEAPDACWRKADRERREISGWAPPLTD